VNKKYNYLFLIIITLIGLFFYTFRLNETQLFIYDTSRDTLKILRLWQDKKITLIGAPASFSLNSEQEIFFGSLYLYLGMLGMIFTNFSPVGAVLANTIIFTLSIPVFYLFISNLYKNQFEKIFPTILYAMSPLTITHARFFWNPNLLIPLSVIFWFLIISSKNNKIKKFIAGITIGIMFNLHYFSIIPLILYLIFSILRKESKHLYLILAGFIISSLPLIIFEIRNNYYLSQAFVFNLFHSKQSFIHNIQTIIDSFAKVFATLIGLRHGEINFQTITTKNSLIFKIFTLIIFLLIIKTSSKIIRKKNNTILLLVTLCNIVINLLTITYDLQLHYLFPIYPLIIWIFCYGLFQIKYYRYLIPFIFIPIIYSDSKIINQKINLKENYLSLSQIESISKSIISDEPTGKYNIAEYLYSDIRGTAFRFFILRDARIKPENEFSYADIKTLYVVSPSLEKIYKENRWEFSASGPKQLISTKNFGDVSLYKFVK
jgi:hypothetical protein